MNEDKLDFERRYGGDEQQRIEELEKELAAFDEISAVRVKHGLNPDGVDHSVHIRVRMQKLEEMVYGDFVAGIKRRLDYVKSYGGSK